MKIQSKVLLFLLLATSFLILPDTSHAQSGNIFVNGNITTSGTTCTPATNCVLFNVGNHNGQYASAVITLTGAGLSGATLQFVSSSDGSQSLSATPVAGGSAVTSATSPTAGTQWRVVVSGLISFGVRASSGVSGTISVNINASVGSASSGGGGSGGTGCIPSGAAGQILIDSGSGACNDATSATDANVVTTTGTQALTNKTLTSGTNTFPTFNQNTTGSAAKWTTARNLAGNSVDGSANVQFANAFIVQGTTDAGLSGAQFLGALGSGLVYNTTTTGVLSIATAAQVNTLIQTLTGCNTATYVYTPQAAACVAPSGGGSGTVNSGTASHLAYYATSTTAVSDMGADFTFSTHTLAGGASAIFDLHSASSFLLPGSLSTGIVKVTTSTGVVSTAIAADFPTLNQNTTGTAANLSGTPALPNGTTATTQSQADASTKLATTAYVDTGLGGKASSTAATTVNGQTCTLGSTCTVPIQTNGTPNTSQAGINHLTSTANSVGLTVTPVNSATNAEKFEITGSSYTGNAATATTAANLSGTPALPNGTTATTQSVSDNTTKIATDAFVLANALTNPMTTLGDVIYGGASGAGTRLAGPTAPNGVPNYLVDIPSSGAAVAETWQLAGVPVDATNPTTLLITDRANYLNWTSGTTLALPAVSGSFASNMPFVIKNTSTTLTMTPNAAASDLIDGASTGTLIPNFASFVYQDGTTAPGHWFTVKFPTFAAFGSTCTNGLTWSTTTGVGCAGAPPITSLTGDVTASGGGAAAATIAANAVTGAKMANNTVTATQLAAQYSKGSCTEVWGGSGTSFALTSGDDSVSNNSCYNDSGVTRTITAVKCLSDNASNTTTVNPTFGSAGTGTTVLSGALTCGNSNAMSSTGTVSNASWTTGTGIDPAMGGTLTGTHIVMLVDFTF